MSRNKRISMVEFINRISEFKNKIMYIKRKYNYLKILYDPKALEDLMNLNKQEFDNLLYLLLDLRNIIYRNVKLKEMNFRYRLWKIEIQENTLILSSENHYLNKKAKIIINLLSEEIKFINKRELILWN